MSKDFFSYPVKYDHNVSIKPNIKKVEFGDGYEQRSSGGLNSILKTYALSFAGSREDCDDIERFLSDKGGYKSFLWYSPVDYKNILVVCEDWSKQGAGNTASLSFTFREVVN